MKIVRYISICLLFTFIGSLLPTKAQDNPYKIDHSLYLLYEEATKHRNNATGLEIADTIYTKAIRINDKKAQCLALTIPVIYYFNNGKTELLESNQQASGDIPKEQLPAILLLWQHLQS